MFSMAPSRSIPSLLHLLSSRSSRNPHSLPRCMSSLFASSSAVCASPLRPSSSSSSYSSSSSCFMSCESSGNDLRSALRNLTLVRKFADHGGEDYSRLLAVGFASLATLSLGQLHQIPASSEKFVETEGTSVDALVTVHPENLAEAFLEELRAACDEDRVMLDLDERSMHGKPWNTYHVLKAIPDVVVYPKSQEEVVAVVNTCAKYKIPLTAYAGGTSLEGHTMTPYAGVTINMNLMKGVKELHLEDMDIVVEPGIGWIELNEYLKPHGLFFPLDPGPGASIGGMCATRCSGSLAVRYGTMRDNVISLKVTVYVLTNLRVCAYFFDYIFLIPSFRVTFHCPAKIMADFHVASGNVRNLVVVANGDVVKTAARARKTAAGYDLTRLMIGSEGTLGIITEVTLRLQKIPEASTVAMCNFKNIRDAADVAIATMHSGIQVSRVELLDEVMMKAINMANDKSFPEEPTLMFEFIGTEASALEQTLRVQKLVEEHTGSDFVFADTPAEKEELWKLRKEAFWSTSALRPGAEALVTDVCVPLSRLAECISTSKEKLDASSLPCSILSHAGDGNFHVIILFDPQSQEEVREVSTLTTGMVHTALSMEGTCTGEHGIGIGKMKFLEEELGLEALMAMGKIKQALDPSNLMNPGKVIPERFCY